MTNDTYAIIPKGATFGRVRPFEFQLRTMVDYDANFLQDRVCADIFVNGHPVGVYAVARIDDRKFGTDKAGLELAMEHYGPGLERIVIDEFMGLGYRNQVQALENNVRELRAYIHRPRWFHFHPVRRSFRRVFIAPITDIRRALAAAIAPKQEES